MVLIESKLENFVSTKVSDTLGVKRLNKHQTILCANGVNSIVSESKSIETGGREGKLFSDINLFVERMQAKQSSLLSCASQ